jgi:hypothetical protein
MTSEDVVRVTAARWRGLKVACVGVVIAGAGFGLAWFRGFQPGLILFFIGWLVVASGAIIHVRQMLRESQLKQSDLHARSPQPWEE